MNSQQADLIRSAHKKANWRSHLLNCLVLWCTGCSWKRTVWILIAWVGSRLEMMWRPNATKAAWQPLCTSKMKCEYLGQAEYIQYFEIHRNSVPQFFQIMTYRLLKPFHFNTHNFSSHHQHLFEVALRTVGCPGVDG